MFFLVAGCIEQLSNYSEPNRFYVFVRSQQLFRTSLAHFDAVIQLREDVSARRHCAVDCCPSNAPKCVPLGELKSPDKEAWPVVNHDSVQRYIEDLRVSVLQPMRKHESSYCETNSVPSICNDREFFA